MEKIYGYKQEDLIALAKIVSQKKHQTLQSVYESFSKQYQKAKGTVRNLYYALIRYAKDNAEFCNQYLGGTIPKVSKIETFSKEKENWLMEQVKWGIEQGKSVRLTVLDLAKGDAKLALRYQNKYRSTLAKKHVKASDIKQESLNDKALQGSYTIPESLLKKLKKDINALVDKISYKEKRENQYLKKRIAFLEAENLKLCKLVYGDSIESSAVKYFSSPQSSSFLH